MVGFFRKHDCANPNNQGILGSVSAARRVVPDIEEKHHAAAIRWCRRQACGYECILKCPNGNVFFAQERANENSQAEGRQCVASFVDDTT